MAEFRAPTANGEVLAVPDFAAVPAMVEANRRKLDRDDVTIGGLSLRDLRALARREVLALTNGQASAGRANTEAPLIVAGHQPELSHPGVWVKNFALNGLAKKLGGIPLHLVADTDTLKTTSLRFPVLPPRGPKAHLESLAFDSFSGEEPYETRAVEDADHVCAFDSFADRSRPLWANWGYEPLLWEAWHSVVHHHHPDATIGERFTAVRREYERRWGCDNLELNVSRLSQTEAFARFASHILGDLPRFRAVYNAAIRNYRETNDVRSKNHPAPELADGEAPFWGRTPAGRRERATASSDARNLRPRALTLTLFARVCLGDFFIHGIGGGKYDEVTDVIIRDYFGIDPPAYQVLSATLHLPLPGFPSTDTDLKRAERLVRDLHWNPDRHLPRGSDADPDIEALVTEKVLLVGREPPYADHAARKDRFRRFRQAAAYLRPYVADRVPVAEAEAERVRAEVAANAVLRRRDYAWVLYPEEMLRAFLTRFLEV